MAINLKEKILLSSLPILLLGCQSGKMPNYFWSYETGPTNAGNYHSVATGDFNSDGNLDIVGGNFNPGGILVWYGNGNGSWNEVNTPSDLGDIRDLACGDINNDGFDDIICTSFGDAKGVRVFLSNGDGTWRLAAFPTEKGTFEGLEVADMNYDGNLDVIAANTSSSGQSDGGVNVWFGDGKGRFSKNYGPQSTGVYRDVAIADFNNDGKLDIVSTRWGVDGEVKVWYGTNRAEWYAGSSPETVGSFIGVTTGDYDGDGRIDICATAYHEGVYLWYQDENGKFTEPCRLLDYGHWWEVQSIDLDFDGDQDIVTTSFGEDGVKIFRNDWKCDWHDWSNLIDSEKTYYGLTYGDFNNDSRPDLAAANYSQGVHIWLQVYDENRYDSGPPRPVETDSLDLWFIEKGTATYGETVYSVFFDTGIADIRPDQEPILEKVAQVINKYPNSKVTLEGHADFRNINTTEYPSNLELSEARGNAVKDALMPRLKSQRTRFIGPVGWSDTRPKVFDPNAPEELQLNRRCDIIIEKVKRTPDYEYLQRVNKFEYADSLDVGVIDEDLLLGETSKPKGLHNATLDPYQNKVFTKASGIPEYIIGSLDVLNIIIWTGLDKKEFEVTVGNSGDVFIPNVGDEKFYVKGKTSTQVENELYEILESVLKKPNVEVDVKYYFAHQSSILGEIRDTDDDDTGPGRYPLTGRETLLDFISNHGGPTKDADLTQIQVIQENGQSLYFNLWATIVEADITQNPVMDANQIVFIPSLTTSSRFVFVFGEVNNPGLIEIKESSGLPLIECIAHAGNFTREALQSDIRIIRGDIDKPNILEADIHKLLKEGDFSQNVKLFDRDIVFVPQTTYSSTTEFINSLNPTLSLLQTFFLVNQVFK
ncbi:MAG: hypothetical protein DWQ06_15330 [Calditrichaeota bacterium]|nr:MAG: hypothetical protein DWQ06_15330 [Calditrichota bacterium]